MTLLEARNLSFSYHHFPELFSDVKLHLNLGECIAICGPSGCGKSSLCNILSGIEFRSGKGDIKGEVLIKGKPLHIMTLKETVETIGIVFQTPDSQLFSPTVEDEIAFGPENLCIAQDDIEKRITEALKLVKMQNYRLHNPNTLSGGQKHLIAIAAVMALNPSILILDEVFSQLDSEYTELVKKIICDLKAKGKAVLLVEHNEENLDIADRVYRFRNMTLYEDTKHG